MPEKTRSNIEKYISSDDYVNSGPLRKILVKVVNEDLTNTANKIKIPTLIIWGEKDKVVLLEHAKELKEIIKDSELRIVWGASHSPHIEKPYEFTEIVEEFIC